MRWSATQATTNFPSTYFEHSFNLSLFGSDIVIFLLSFILDNINEQSRPIAPAPCTKVLDSDNGFLMIFHPL